MFGPGGLGGLKRLREQAACATDRDVTEAEFIAAVMATGQTRERAEFHARIQKGLGGARTLVGREMLMIVDEGRDGTA